MADALEPLLKKIRIAIGKKLGMPSYQEVNAQDFPTQIDRIPTIADGSIPKYQGPFMVTPGPNAQTIQTEGKYSEANITVAPAPPSGVEIKEYIIKNGQTGEYKLNKNIIIVNITTAPLPSKGEDFINMNAPYNYSISLNTTLIYRILFDTSGGLSIRIPLNINNTGYYIQYDKFNFGTGNSGRITTGLISPSNIIKVSNTTSNNNDIIISYYEVD